MEKYEQLQEAVNKFKKQLNNYSGSCFTCDHGMEAMKNARCDGPCPNDSSLSVLLDLASQYLAQKGWPEKKCEERISDWDAGLSVGFNRAIDACRLAALKGVPSVKEIFRMLCDAGQRNRKLCAGDIINIDYDQFYELSKSIHDLFKERVTGEKRGEE